MGWWSASPCLVCSCSLPVDLEAGAAKRSRLLCRVNLILVFAVSNTPQSTINPSLSLSRVKGRVTPSARGTGRRHTTGVPPQATRGENKLNLRNAGLAV